MATEANTAYKLCKALRALTSPVFATDMAAKTWLRQFGPKSDLSYIDSACHLESMYGDRTRQHKEIANAELTSEALGYALLLDKCS